MEKFFKEYRGDVSLVPDAELYELVSVAYTAYRMQQPIVPDSIYDALESRLLSIEPDALERIDATVGLSMYREHIKLPHEMNGIVQVNDVSLGEMETNKSLNDYIKTCGSAQFVVSDKLDGCSAMLWYRGGKLRQAFSKHSGEEGLDITRHISLVTNVPKQLPQEVDIFVRGEVIIRKDVFEKNWSIKNGTGEYVNPRNFVAGKLNSKEPEVVALSQIDFVAYTICGSEDNKKTQLETLSDLGFSVVNNRFVSSHSMKKKELDSLTEQARSESSYELDGLVFDPHLQKYNENLVRKYKVIAETAEATVVSVEWNLRKDGDFRPVVVIEPIDLGGVTVSRASAFNAFYIKHGRLKSETNKPDFPIGPGAKISIIRSGDVIPDIQAVLIPANEPSLPSEDDWGPYEWSESGIHLRIINDSHPDVVLRNLSYFFDTIGVEDFRESSIKKVLESLPNSTVSSICRMKPEEFVYCGFGQRQSLKIYENIQKKIKNLYFPDYMAATNKFGRLWGSERCSRVWNHLRGDIGSIRETNQTLLVENLVSIDGIAKTTATEFVSRLNSFFEFHDSVSDIFNFHPYEEEHAVGDALKGWSVVFTGFRDPELENLITSNGGVMSSWSNPTHIVTKDKSVMRPKIQKAIDKGAQFLSRSEFAVLVSKNLGDFTSSE